LKKVLNSSFLKKINTKKRNIKAYNCLVYTAKDMSAIVRNKFVVIALKFFAFSHFTKYIKEPIKKNVAVKCGFGHMAEVLKAGIRNNINENKKRLFLSIFEYLFLRQI
jgi:hypothetical protein